LGLGHGLSCFARVTDDPQHQRTPGIV
jgi:hypothetical protein